MGVDEKDEMRDMAIHWFDAPRTAQDQIDMLDYCQVDVDATARLLKAMLPRIDIPRAIGLHGRYMRAVAAMEPAGVPIDTPALDRLRANWEPIKSELITDMDAKFHVFEDGHFRQDRFEALLIRLGIPWPLS